MFAGVVTCRNGRINTSKPFKLDSTTHGEASTINSHGTLQGEDLLHKFVVGTEPIEDPSVASSDPGARKPPPVFMIAWAKRDAPRIGARVEASTSVLF